jgi:hypothetical protein
MIIPGPENQKNGSPVAKSEKSGFELAESELPDIKGWQIINNCFLLACE